MRYLIILALGLICSQQAMAQDPDWKKIKEANADKILMSGPRKPTKVLLLGTFHFAYPNLDDHKTDSADFVDVLAPERQKELAELAAIVQRFQPTRMYVESFRQSFHDSLYGAYRSGKYAPGRNEIFQIGYRVAGMMNLDKVYCVDASNFMHENYSRFTFIDSMWNAPKSNPERDTYWSRLYKKMYDLGDSLNKELTMLENFLLMAEPITQRRMHGAYLAGGFNTKDHSGPDGLAMWWYSRNLRIFNNILNTSPGDEDRIVVLFGNGHAPILRHCFEASPEFELVELKDLLGKR